MRRLIDLRRLYPSLSGDGDLIPVYTEANRYPLVYLRRSGREEILVALNPSGYDVKSNIKEDYIKNKVEMIAGRGSSLRRIKDNYQLTMKPLSYGVFC